MVDGDGCSTTTEIELVDPLEITFSLDTLVNVMCPGGSNGLFGVTASGGTGLGTFAYSIDGTTFQPTGFFNGLPPDNYTVTARDSNGCLGSFPVNIIEDNLLFPNEPIVEDNLCYGESEGSATASATGGYPPYEYSIDGVTFQTDPLLENLAAGTYTLFVMDSDGCIVETTFVVGEPEQLELDAGDYLPIPGGGSVELVPVTNADPVVSWTWTPPTALSCTNCENPIASPEETLWYVLTVVDGSGCVATDSTEIEVIRNLAIPNAFSPNGDGVNDLFIIRTPFLNSYLLRIYNRWGQEVFVTNDIEEGWDGTYKGNPQDVGMYIFYMDAVDTDGVELKRTGPISLVR
jgi:gliding motility-associated-like protein